MEVRRRALIALAGALAFGLVLGLVHGNDGGLRGALGNLSAPWLLIALVPGWWAGSALRGAVIGTSATLVALAGFYLALTATMAGHLGTVHGALPSLVFVLASNRIWFVAGLMSGPACGALAGLAGRMLRPRWLCVALGALLVGEIGAVYGLNGVALPLLNLRWGVYDWRAYQIEAVLGVAILLGLALRSRGATRTGPRN